MQQTSEDRFNCLMALSIFGGLVISNQNEKEISQELLKNIQENLYFFASRTSFILAAINSQKVEFLLQR